MKRLVPILLVLCLILAFPVSGLAAPDRNTIVDQVTVRFPGVPGLEITLTDVPLPVATHDAVNQTKFYYGPNTTLSFNRDMTLEAGSFKANTQIKASSYAPGTLSTTIVAASDGTFYTTNSSSITTYSGEAVYYFGIVDIKFYMSADESGYTYRPITDLAISGTPSAPTTTADPVVPEPSLAPTEIIDSVEPTAPSVPTVISDVPDASIAFGSDSASYNVGVPIDYNGDRKAEYTYAIPNVLKTERIKFVNASEFIDKNADWLPALSDKELPVYTVKAGTKVSYANAKDGYFTLLSLKNGKLIDYTSDWYTPGDPDSERRLEDMAMRAISFYPSNAEAWGSLDQGPTVSLYGAGSYIEFIEEGYYLWAPIPLVPELYALDAANGYSLKETEVFKYNPVVLHVVK